MSSLTDEMSPDLPFCSLTQQHVIGLKSDSGLLCRSSAEQEASKSLDCGPRCVQAAVTNGTLIVHAAQDDS